MMKERWVIAAVKMAIFLTVVVVGFGSAVLQLWNWLIPSIFGLRAIGYWEAVGLLGLSWLLFGGLRFFPAHARARSERLERMTAEQREAMRAGLKSCARS